MAPRRHVVDWTLPEAWSAQDDLTVLGGRPPLFEDPWGVLEPAGGVVTVAVLHADGGSADRQPPTLLLERRGLRTSSGKARQRLAHRPGGQGLPEGARHAVVTTPHGPVTVVSTRAWGATTGPDVRVVAVVVPDRSAEALVLTLTWDDENGLERLEALATELVAGMAVHLREPTPIGGGRRTSTTPGPEPERWAGAAPGSPLRPAADVLTTLSRAVLSGDPYRRARNLMWMLLAVVVGAAVIGRGTLVGIVLGGVVLAGCVLVPALLAWRMWTIVHGLRTDGEEVDRAVLPRRSPLGTYLALAVLVGVATLLEGVLERSALFVLVAWFYLGANLAAVVLTVARDVLAPSRSPAR